MWIVEDLNGRIKFQSMNETAAREFHKKYGGILYEKEIE